MSTITGTARSSSVTKSSEYQDQQSEYFRSDEFEKNYLKTTPDEYYAMEKEADDAKNSGSLLDMQKIFRKFCLHFEPSVEERLGPLEKTTIFYNEAYLRREMAIIGAKYHDLALDRILYNACVVWERKLKN